MSNTEGAPPPPPPGGYRGAARPRGPEQLFGLTSPSAPTTIEVPGARAAGRSAWGLVTLILASAFALALIIMMGLGSVDAIFSMTTLAIQAVVVGVIIAALVSPAARRLGIIALAVSLVFNAATTGAISSSQSSMSGSYEGKTSPEDKLWEQYPGLKDAPAEQILGAPSLEQVRTRSEAVMADVRTALSDRFGYTWASPTPESLSPVRNGYGGESMVQAYVSTEWTTNEKITSVREKQAVMDVIDRVIASHQMSGLYALNDPASGLHPAILEKLYGANSVREQPVWEWYSYNFDGVSRMYANIYDLSLDESGQFRDARQSAHDRTGEPLEGLQLTFYADTVLSESDVAEFRKLLEKYPK